MNNQPTADLDINVDVAMGIDTANESTNNNQPLR
jgi:hypothetical protein